MATKAIKKKASAVMENASEIKEIKKKKTVKDLFYLSLSISSTVFSEISLR